MISLALEREPLAARVEVTAERLIVHLDDGRAILAPLSWFPRLLHATPAERAEWTLLGDGDVIEWPELDEHLEVQGLLAGRRSGESDRSLLRWLSARGERRPPTNDPPSAA